MSGVARVAVIGAGVIGAGVAQSLAQTGHEVVLVDLNDDILAAAARRIRTGVRSHHLVSGSGERLDTAAVMGRLELTTDPAMVADVDFVIENVTEHWDTKRGVYGELDRLCSPEVVFAANTSAIPITRIAGATGRPDRVLGMHFMNPVPLKPVVEVIRGRMTSDETVDRAAALLAAMGKEGIVVNDSPGFVSNRVLMLTINEAVLLLQEGVASAADIDEIFRRCFGHAMGPLETADLIGLDTVLRSVEVLQEELADSKYRPCSLLESMVRSGLLGRKSGEGFFSYGERTHTPSQEV